jgi:archaellum component FlaC
MKEIKELYNDIDNCITKLVSSRINGDKQLEQNSLSQMESLMVQTKQLLTYIIENNETTN